MRDPESLGSYRESIEAGRLTAPLFQPSEWAEYFRHSAGITNGRENAEATEVHYVNAATCPDCGAGMVRLGLCTTCLACGYGSCGD